MLTESQAWQEIGETHEREKPYESRMTDNGLCTAVTNLRERGLISSHLELEMTAKIYAEKVQQEYAPWLWPLDVEGHSHRATLAYLFAAASA